MGVEVDKRETAVLRSASTQHGEGGGVVTAQNNGEYSGVEDGGELGLKVNNGLLDVAGKDVQITVVDYAEGVEGGLEFVRLPMMRT
jgi:hypothetical protein